MSGRKSKNKGAVGERELAQLFKAHGFDAQRGIQFQGGQDSPDVKTEIGWLHIECKRCEALSVYKAMEQAINDAGLDQIPSVFHRRNNKPWLVVMSAEDFLIFLKKMKDKGAI